jgi:hypothetical protein
MKTISLKGGSLSRTYWLPDEKIVRKEISRIENREYGFMRWYSQLKKLQEYNTLYPGLFPKVVNVDSNKATAWFDLEYLEGFRDIKSILSKDILSEDQIFRMSQAVWKGLNTLHSIKKEPIPGAPRLYFDEEIDQKIADAISLPSFKDFFYRGTYGFNGDLIVGIGGYLHGLKEYFAELENDDECNIHGNPTLENIMYSFEEDRVVFIDVYDESMWNTKYLDYAQVLQCSRSHYGFINDRDVRVIGIDLFNPHGGTEHFDTFNKHFISELPEDKMKLIDILEASQFIRMLPFKLIAGDINKAKYFYVHACKLFSKAMK